MMNQHPITPPPELLQQWADEWYKAETEDGSLADHIATQAAHWGADQELEADCEWLRVNKGRWFSDFVERDLRAARRPKPPSLKERALAKIDAILIDCGRVLREDEREALEASRLALEEQPPVPLAADRPTPAPGDRPLLELLHEAYKKAYLHTKGTCLNDAYAEMLRVVADQLEQRYWIHVKPDALRWLRAEAEKAENSYS